jgi:hypothetical protein
MFPDMFNTKLGSWTLFDFLKVWLPVACSQCSHCGNPASVSLRTCRAFESWSSCLKSVSLGWEGITLSDDILVLWDHTVSVGVFQEPLPAVLPQSSSTSQTWPHLKECACPHFVISFAKLSPSSSST